jgi:ureidoglycolate hydrolase
MHPVCSQHHHSSKQYEYYIVVVEEGDDGVSELGVLNASASISAGVVTTDAYQRNLLKWALTAILTVWDLEKVERSGHNKIRGK